MPARRQRDAPAMFRESDIAYDEILVQRNQELDFSARHGENQ